MNSQEGWLAHYSMEAMTAALMFLLDMAVQSVSTTENTIAFPEKPVLEMLFRNMADEAFLIHYRFTFRPIAPDFSLIASYNSVLIA